MSKALKDLRDRRKQEDDEENQRQAQKALNRSGGNVNQQVNILADETGSTDYNAKLSELLDRAAPMVEQVNALYNQYFSGVETRPPVERRKNLDGLMKQLDGMPKPTIQHTFRYNNIQSSYVTYKNRWEKQSKAIESGRLKRPAGPKRAA